MRTAAVGLFISTLTTTTLLACPPFDGDDNVGSSSGSAGAGGATAAAVERALMTADQKLPLPPSTETLCMLQFEETSFDAAKKLFGKPSAESTDKSMAGLSYRYRGEVTLILSFDWHDGTPGWGTVLTGIGSSSQLKSGYLLATASLTGAPYPSCWPHEEP